MKILVIIVSNKMFDRFTDNIKNHYDSLRLMENVECVDFCGISSIDDFSVYESVITFKYKIINSVRGMSKICDFITKYKDELDYDWFVKSRPENKLLEPIQFGLLLDNAINARARVYRGPKKIKYGCSVNGEGQWKDVGDVFFDEEEKEIVLDEQIYVFHKNVINNGGFEPVEDDNTHQHEWFHNRIWLSRGISFNLIGINTIHTHGMNRPGSTHEMFSGNINC
jgi:hypothetical protein